MKYRTFGRLAWKPSALGFGTMRLPTIGQDQTKINKSEAIKMLRYAIDRGVNYIDTAYPYHAGQSEILVGQALKGGYRKKVKLATKIPVWLVSKPGDFDRFLNEQLKKLQTNNIDFYLLHALNKKTWEAIKKFDVFSWSQKAIKDGRIGYLGFSFHDEFNVFKEIIDAYDRWTFCQIQYNILDANFQAGIRGLKYAAEQGLAVVIMEPLKGGSLAHPPEPIKKILENENLKKSAVDYALQWIWNQPEVSLLLSGMSNLTQVKQNIQSASRSSPNSLSPKDLALIEKVVKRYQALKPIPCTNCQYCLPCPQNINIPKVFETYNSQKTFYGLKETQRCLACGRCESVCPQNIPIIKWFKELSAST